MNQTDRTLFLDDERIPPVWVTPRTSVMRTVEDAVQDIQRFGVPTVLSLDHDLGEGETAMSFLRWLIDRHLDGDLDARQIRTFCVHSANPVGAQNLIGLWVNFAETIGHRCEVLAQPATTWMN